MSVRVVCVNLGSRTAKFSLHAVGDGAVLGRPASALAESDAALEHLDDPHAYDAIDFDAVDVVAYRVVRIAQLPSADAIELDDRTRASIAAAAELAPLHTRSVLQAFDVLHRRAPKAKHVAVFDAAFHRTIPECAAVYGLPYDDARDGWRKVGFHGLSYAYVSARVRERFGAERTRKLVALHLGGGCSAAAIDEGRSVETTMGFTPTDGLLMATRSGSVDVGLLLAYMRAKRLSIDETEHVVSQRSGLLGLGGSADMRDIRTAIDGGDARAALAYDVFVHRARAAVGAMSAALHGLDAIAFAGGIGEHDAHVRADICLPFAYLGADVDACANATPLGDAVLSSEGSRVLVTRVETREDWSMALAAVRA